jgi:PIN domain nuclease of toxin-antitoxin system
MIVLDTHAALWATFDTSSLGKRCRRIIGRAAEENQLAISAISFWEIALLIAKQRLRRTDSAEEIRRQIIGAGAAEIAIRGDIAILAAQLEGLHADPADRFIAATAIAHEATLVTADQRLLDWRHSLRRHNAET